MRPTRSHSQSSTISSSSNHSSTSTLLESTTFVSEKHTKTRPRSSNLLATAKKRYVHVTVAAIVIGFLIANVIFRLSILRHPTAVYETFQHFLSDQLKSQRLPGPTDATIRDGSRPTVVALVSFERRSRTEILDCYLRQNLASNGGLIDSVIFSPDVEDEVELDWLRNTVGEVDGYNLLSTNSTDAERYSGLKHKLMPFDDTHGASGSLAKPWVFANALARTLQQPEEQPEPLFLFMNSETIYLSPDTIASMIYTHQMQPEHSLIQANVVNQRTLSWIHSRLGALKAYRPEYTPIVSEVYSSDEGEPREGVTESQQNDAAPSHSARQTGNSWRASELPLWTDHDSFGYTSADDAGSAPQIFGIPIDLKPSNARTRWLPFDTRIEETSADAGLNFRHRPSVSSPLTQKTLVMNGPGQWPWTLATQQLYSFLEHLEEEEELARAAEEMKAGTSTPTRIGDSRGLARYRFPLWSCESEAVELSLFLISSSDLIRLSGSSHLFPPNADGLDVGRWILRDDIRNSMGGRTPVIDGNAIAARYLDVSGSSTWTDGPEEMARGLDSTDLLGRFQAYGRDVGCKTVL